MSLLLACAFSDEGGSNLASLKLGLEVALESLAKPLEKIDLQYSEHLEALESKFTEAGELDAVLRIHEELQQPGVKIATDPLELKRIQTIYLAERKKRAASLELASLAKHEKYLAAVGQLKISLTKAGNIKGAVEVDAEMKRVEALVSKARSKPASPMFSIGSQSIVIVDEHEGSAGHQHDANTYSFRIKSSSLPVERAHIVYYASAPSSSGGKISLTVPKSDDPIKIGEWKSSDSAMEEEKRASGSKFFGKYFGRRIELGKQITAAGLYTVKFSWASGDTALSIGRVELHLNPPENAE